MGVKNEAGQGASRYERSGSCAEINFSIPARRPIRTNGEGYHATGHPDFDGGMDQQNDRVVSDECRIASLHDLDGQACLAARKNARPTAKRALEFE